MIGLPQGVRVLLCTQPTDMRKSFDGLIGLTRQVLEQDPLSGHLFVFVNRRGTQAKVLYWSSSGYCIWAKRLERGRFAQIGHGDEVVVNMNATQWMMWLEGIEFKDVRYRKRFCLPALHTASRVSATM